MKKNILQFCNRHKKEELSNFPRLVFENGWDTPPDQPTASHLYCKKCLIEWGEKYNNLLKNKYV